MSVITFNCLFADLTQHIADDMIKIISDLVIEADDEQYCISQART